MLNFKNTKLIQVSDWNSFIRDTYKRPYDLEAQEGGRNRGIIEFTVPITTTFDYDRTELAKGQEGVSFQTWLNRDTNQQFDPSKTDKYYIMRYFEWRFYPSLEMIVNDLYAKGLIEQGHYVINIE